jgi:hypothetical protein
MSEATKQILFFFIAFVMSTSASTAESKDEAAAQPGLTDSAAQPSVAKPSASASPTLRETIVNDSLAKPADNSVEAFFQVSPSKRNSPQNLSMQAETFISTEANKSKSHSNGVSRCIWHILDNAGIPMFWGQDTSYIDPSIRETYLTPPPKLPGEGAAVKEIEKTTTTQVSQPPLQPATANSSAMLQKIPESELEGVPLPTPRDETNVPTP